MFSVSFLYIPSLGDFVEIRAIFHPFTPLCFCISIFNLFCVFFEKKILKKERAIGIIYTKHYSTKNASQNRLKIRLKQLKNMFLYFIS